MFTIIALCLLAYYAISNLEKQAKRLKKMFPEWPNSMCKQKALDFIEFDIIYRKYMIIVGFIIDIILLIIFL